MTKTVYVLNGSNLNMLGKREPHIYGTTTLAEIEASCLQLSRELGLACVFRQTNYEGQMVDWLQEAFEKKAAVVINPAGFSFHSIPVLDALKMIETTSGRSSYQQHPQARGDAPLLESVPCRGGGHLWAGPGGLSSRAESGRLST